MTLIFPKVHNATLHIFALLYNDALLSLLFSIRSLQSLVTGSVAVSLGPLLQLGVSAAVPARCVEVGALWPSVAGRGSLTLSAVAGWLRGTRNDEISDMDRKIDVE